MSGGAHPHGDCPDCAAERSKLAAALREVAELREANRNLQLSLELHTAKDKVTMTHEYCEELEQAARERDELRARMEDARRLASCIEEDAAPDDLDYAAAKRILSHPAPAPAERSTLDVIGRIGTDGYRTIDLRDKVPAPATCPECGGTGVAMFRGAGYVNTEPTAQACPACSVRP